MKAESGDILVDDIANYLQDKGAGVIGKTLFVHHMPEAIKSGICVINNLNGAKVDPDIPNYRRCRFRLIARAANYPAGFALMNGALPHLTIRQKNLGNIEIKQLIPENDPIVFPRSYGSGVFEVSVALTAIYAINTVEN